MSAGGHFAEPHPLLHKVEALQKGELSTNEIVLLCQDIVERDEAISWGQHVYNLILHCVTQNLCTAILVPRRLQ